MCKSIETLEDEDVETLYVWLYEDSDKFTVEDRRHHLTQYALSYYQFKSAKEILPKRLRRKFIEKILFISRYIQECNRAHRKRDLEVDK